MHNAHTHICTPMNSTLSIRICPGQVTSAALRRQRRLRALRLDHIMMEGHTLCLSVLFLSVAHPKAELGFVGLASALVLWRALTLPLLARAALLHTSVAAVASALWAIFRCGGTGHMGVYSAGICLTLFGFVAKVADASGAWMFGTSLFHYMEAAGFTSLYIWSQTLPPAAP